MDIKSFLQCKKPRRSNRLEGKRKEENAEKTLDHTPLGYFTALPLELKFQVLRYLRIEDLSILTISSKAMRNVIEGFCIVRPLIRKDAVQKLHVISPHLPLPIEKQTELVNTFTKLGLLMKRSTCLYTTKDRLKLVNEVLTKLQCSNSKGTCEDVQHCVAMTCFGKFLHTVIAGWDDCECQRVYDTISHHTAVVKNLRTVLNSKCGCHQRLEFEIRCFFRRVFLDQSQSLQDRAFWLTRVLKPWPLVHQARILFILYGPILGDEILWNEMCENTPSNSAQSAQHFGELANALQILHQYKQEWTEDNVVSVIDEITSSPDEWLAENVAHLLILCGDTITAKLLVSKAINGRMIELSSVITSFCVVCVKNSFNLSYVVTMIQHILSVIDSVDDKQNFFYSIMDMFKELIMDTHDFGDTEDDHSSDMYYLVTSLVEFTKKIVQMGFKNKLKV